MPTIAWAVKKRHIFNDGVFTPICETNSKSSGYSVSNGQYSSYQLDFPTNQFNGDSKYTHGEGIIPAKLISEIGNIETKSICKKCLAKYTKLIEAPRKALEEKIKVLIGRKYQSFNLMQNDVNLLFDSCKSIDFDIRDNYIDCRIDEKCIKIDYNILGVNNIKVTNIIFLWHTL